MNAADACILDPQNLNFDLFETLEFLAIKGFLGKFINTIANYGREHEKSLTEKISNLDNIARIRKKNLQIKENLF